MAHGNSDDPARTDGICNVPRWHPGWRAECDDRYVSLSQLANNLDCNIWSQNTPGDLWQLFAVSEAGLNSVDGGNPMDLDGEIFLCGRSSGDVTRGYEGLLAELSIFDSTLTASQIEALFYTVRLGLAEISRLSKLDRAMAPLCRPSRMPVSKTYSGIYCEKGFTSEQVQSSVTK